MGQVNTISLATLFHQTSNLTTHLLILVLREVFEVIFFLKKITRLSSHRSRILHDLSDVKLIVCCCITFITYRHSVI